MALEKQVVSIPFVGGLDTKTDPKLVEAGGTTAVADGIYTKGKTILKRNGYDALTTNILSGGSISTGVKLGKLNNELIEFDNSNLYSYSETSSKWVTKGTISNITVDSQFVGQTTEGGFGSTLSDIALNSNIKVIAWFQDATTIKVSAIDNVNSNQYISSQTVATVAGGGSSLKVIAVGTLFYIIWIDGAAIKYKTISTTTPSTISSVTTLVAANVSQTNTGNLDAISTTAGFALAYVDSATGDLVVNSYNSSAVLLNTSSTATTLTLTSICLALDSSNQNIFVGFTDHGFLKYYVLSSVLASVLGITLIDSTTTVPAPTASPTQNITAVIESANNARFFWDYFNIYGGSTNNSLNDFQINTATATSTGTVVATKPLKRGLTLCSKPFVYSSNTYVVCRSDSFFQGTFYLLDKSGNVLAKADVDRAAPLFPNYSDRLSSVINPASGEFHISKEAIIGYVNSGITTPIKNTAELTFKLSTTDALRSKEMNNTLVIGGGLPSLYDGASVSEFGFNQFPENAGFTVTNAGGFLQTGTYVYYFVYEWIDAQGNKYQSAPSTGTSVVITVNNSLVALDIPTLRLTTKNNVYIVIYRTESNGTIPYRLPFVGDTGSGANPPANNTAVDYITFNDTNIDTSINSQPILYTTGGVLDNIAPPAFKQAELYKNRMILSGLEDGKTFWYSKQIISGEGILFNDALYVTVDSLGGDITATKALDDKLIIFKDNLIFEMSGDGPLDTGEQNTFTMPQLISTDVGCPYPDSIVLMPTGLMFKSYKGIYHLSRSLQVSYLGAGVESYNSQTVKAATLLENVNQIRFLTDSGRTLLYDYYYDKWNTFRNHTGNDAVISNGVYYYLRSNGVVYKENSSSFTDAGTAIVLNPVSAWIKLSSLEGYQRVKRAAILGNYYSAHTLTVKVYYDYNDTVYDSYTFNTTTGLIGSDNVYQFRIHLKRQKCEAIKFEFDDSVAAIPGQGYSINDVAVEVGIKRGINKLPAIKSVG